jgi:hypothetical protein
VNGRWRPSASSGNTSFRRPGTPEKFWQHFSDIAVPFLLAFDGLPPQERDAAIGEVIATAMPPAGS